MGIRRALGFGASVMAGLLVSAAAAAQEWKIERLVPGSAFHGVHGIRFSPEGELYAGSVAGQSLYAVDVEKGTARVLVGPPQGMADDIAFGPGGQVVWTAISDGIVYTRRSNGPVEVLAKGLASINSIAFSRDGKRLFAAQVFGGDDLWELDPAGVKPPRKIRSGMGGFNSFWPGPDGKLYGPLWFKGQVVRIDPDSGELEVVAEGLTTPASVKFDSQDNLYVIDTATGELIRVDVKTGGKSVVAKLSTALDNFAVGPGDKLYVSNMADNGIQEVDPATGRVRQVIKGALAIPADIAADGGTLFVADVFAYRAVDARTGAVTDLARVHAAGSKLEYPTGVSIGKDRVLLASSPTGSVMAYDRKSGAFQRAWHGFAAPSDVLELADGDLLVAEMGAGRLTRVRGERAVPILQDLVAPGSLAAGPHGSVFVAETGAGRLLRVDPATGARMVLAEGLALPKGLAVLPDGRVAVLEVGARRIVAIPANGGAKAVLAENLPVGLVTRPVPLAGGLAADAAGALYLASDVENSIYRLTPPRP